MLFERCEKAFEGLGIDRRDVRSPEEVGKALSLCIDVGHGSLHHETDRLRFTPRSTYTHRPQW